MQYIIISYIPTGVLLTRQRVGHDGEKDPGENLGTIIRARDILEENSHRHRTLLRAVGLAHSAELEMHCSVDALADKHSNKTNVDEQGILHSPVQGVAKSVSHL